MEQTKLGSFIEACINTAIGFMVTLALTPVVYPLFGHAFTLSQNLGISAIFTVVRIARGYVIRRWANARIRRAAYRLARAQRPTGHKEST